MTTRTLALTGHTFDARSTDTLPRNMVTSQRVLPVALALVLTVLSILPMIAFQLAELSQEARRAGALSGHWVAGRSVPALALALAAQAIGSHGAQLTAPRLGITWRTLAKAIDV